MPRTGRPLEPYARRAGLFIRFSDTELGALERALQAEHPVADEHDHSGIALLTPRVVYYGEAASVLERRSQVLEQTYRAHPERFVRRAPRPLELPGAVWINPPDRDVLR